VNLKNGILEISRPLDVDAHKCAPLELVGTESPEIRALARPNKPVDPEGKTEFSTMNRPVKPIATDTVNDIPALERPLKPVNSFRSNYEIPAQLRPIKAYSDQSYEY
jgi:hypothetical protein